MFKQLRLQNFKNFKDAQLDLGPFTILVGTNASGKSNIREAFRFLHGISRGYSLSEIIGTKYGEGGELQWRGIRGGTREIAYSTENQFGLGTTLTLLHADEQGYHYDLEVWPEVNLDIGQAGGPPKLIAESFYVDHTMIYDSDPHNTGTRFPNNDIRVTYLGQVLGRFQESQTNFSSNQPVLSQIIDPFSSKGFIPTQTLQASNDMMSALNSMRFLDLNSEAMRQPSFPGQIVLGDRGENLSSVLQAICQEEASKRTLLSWLQELTPMDAKDFEFPPDQIGRVLATLVEANGHRTSAYSASDGTLRFLAMIAALLGPEAADLYFFEELDNGIHPTRLHLLLQLIEQNTRLGKTQVVATTHSPALLRLLSPDSLEHVSLIYRSPDRLDARIIRLMDLPDAKRILQEQDVATLLESGWLEDAVAFQDASEATA